MGSEKPEHKQIKTEIVSVCSNLGYQTVEEYRSKGWRADVLVTTSFDKVAFEVQLHPQSLKKTLERQRRYPQDGVRGCWLFQKPVSKLLGERPDLPLFFVSIKDGSTFTVSLSDRKDLPLHIFVKELLAGGIKFCERAKTKPRQDIKIVFFEMRCWKCKAMNHVYYVDASFRAACNAALEPEEHIWGFDSTEYRREIIKAARDFITTKQGRHLRLGKIKPRYSRTVRHAYASFGCYRCDSIFGDWFVMEAEMEVRYGVGQVATIERTIDLLHSISLPTPHWCYPEGQLFCDAK